MDAYVPAKEVTKYYSISSQTLRVWADKGLVRALRVTESGQFLYNAKDLRERIGIDGHAARHANAAAAVGRRRRRFCYARVSSAHQRADLARASATPSEPPTPSTSSSPTWLGNAGQLLLCGVNRAQLVSSSRRFFFLCVQWPQLAAVGI